MPTCDDYTEARFIQAYESPPPLGWEQCKVCENHVDKLFEGDACEDCAVECDACWERFHPEWLEEDEDGGLICEVCSADS